MLSHAEARSVLLAAFAANGMAAPTLSELQGVGGIGNLEGLYGSAFGGANNWGAIQCGHGPPCHANCVEVGDTHADGSGYQWCYRRYPTPTAGASDLVRELYRRELVPESLRAGDAQATAKHMRATGYFEAPADKYARGIAQRAEQIASALGEPLAFTIGGVAPQLPRPGPTREVAIDPGPAAVFLGLGTAALTAIMWGRKRGRARG